MNIISFLQPTTGNFLVRIITTFIKGTSSIALGVVLFTLILKLITLPFDYFSKSSMRKNSLKMEQMRPELEKLQKQYAGNKDLYNQKMMALYKKNGYSMFGMCLPTIVTLVIFIVAINAFQSYSKYQNLEYYYDMSVSYNNVVYSGIDTDGTYIKRDTDGSLIIDDKYFVENASSGEYTYNFTDGKGNSVSATATLKLTENGNKYYELTTSNAFSKYVRYYTLNEDGSYTFGTISYQLIEGKIDGGANNALASSDNNYLKNSVGLTYGEAKTEAEANGETLSESDFIQGIQREKSAETFRNNGSKFLWIKNIWITDSATKHPVESSWTTFVKTYSYDTSSTLQDMSEEKYNELTANLSTEKTTANGYYILVALTAASSFLTQFIMSKTQKSSMELQTVDGQGAQQQKMMMWMMPIMMAIFSFMYTAAFSIYIVLSSVLGILNTFVINFIVDRKFKKLEEEANKGVVHSKVRVVKEQPKEEKKDEPEQVDFLSGLADKNKKKKK